MNFTTKNIQQYHILANFYLPHSSSLLILSYFTCVWFGNIILSWTWEECSQYPVMMASFTKWDTSLNGTLQAGPMGVPLSEVLLYILQHPLSMSKSSMNVTYYSSFVKFQQDCLQPYFPLSKVEYLSWIVPSTVPQLCPLMWQAIVFLMCPSITSSNHHTSQQDYWSKHILLTPKQVKNLYKWISIRWWQTEKFKGNIWVPMAFHSNALLILTS